MERRNQTTIAKRLGISKSYMSKIANAVARPRWPLAKRLAEETGTDPVFWLEGAADDLKAAIKKTPQ